MLPKILCAILFSHMLFAISTKDIEIKSTCVNIWQFNQSQKDIIFYAYNYGKDYGYGYLMAAIAWQESCAGLYLLNFQDPSAGIYHAHLPSVIKKYTKYKDSAFMRNIVGQMLISDPMFASSIALDSIRYWSKIYGNDIKSIIKSYNAGFAWKQSQKVDKRAREYYNEISKKIKILKQYINAYQYQYELKSMLDGSTLQKSIIP